MIRRIRRDKLVDYIISLIVITALIATMYFIPARLTGLAVLPPGANVVNLTPIAAIDNLYIEQISPDNGANDGTVDLSNNDARWLTNDGDNINVTAWNQTITGNIINNVTAYCEVDFLNPKGGDISFSFNTGTGYNSWICRKAASSQSIFKCDLFSNGVDTLDEVNNLDLRCKMNNSKSGAIGFSIDSIRLEVVYTQIVTTTSSTSTSSSVTSSSSTSSSTSSSSSTTSTWTSSTTTSTTSSTSSSTTTTSSTSSSTSISSTTTSTTSSTSTSSSTSSTTSTSTTSSTSSSTSTSTSSTTTEEATSTVESPRERRTTSTIQAILTTSIAATSSIIEEPQAETTIQAATTIQPTGLFAIAGNVARDNIAKPSTRLAILIAAIAGLIYIYYRQKNKAEKHFKHISVKALKKEKRKSYYKS